MPEIELRPLTRADYPLLSEWLREPAVRRWWADDPSLSAIEEEYGAAVDGFDPTRVLVASEQGMPFGLIQWYRYADEPEYVAELDSAIELPHDATSIDYLVGVPEARRRGLGSAMVTAVLDQVQASGSRTVVVPVHAGNESSWRMLEGCGFHRVGEADLEPDNPEDDRRHLLYRLDLPPRLAKTRTADRGPGQASVLLGR